MWPCGALRSVAEQVHNDGALFDSLIHVEEILSGNPAILLRLFPTGTILPHADDHVEAIVTQVQALAVSLRAVPDESECIVLEVVLHIFSSC